MTQKAFEALMAEYGAVPHNRYPLGNDGYIITLCGHRLWCKYSSDKKYGDWVFARWDTGDPALLAAYKAAPRNGNPWPNDETEESLAAYAAYEASEKADHAAIKAKGLPHNNPYTLKWNHGGYGDTSALESFKQGLATIKGRE